MASRIDEEQLRYQSLLVELASRLEADRRVERELDRHFASRFNVFEYVRTDELGLSRVIADLLDPTKEHGQGTAFLKAMLERFPLTEGRLSGPECPPARSIVVRTERATNTGGRIDITVDIPDGDKSFCLAFENKPYAPQEADQVTGYLRYLRGQYEQRFLLVYLPPSGEGPSNLGIQPTDCELWLRHFVVMPYVGENSLADWFAACRRRCEAERMRVFLRDAELFCQTAFGESMMTSTGETQTAKEYLLGNPDHLRTAVAVHDAWLLVRDEVCRRFLERLRDEVEDRIREELSGADCHVRCQYGDKPYEHALWIFGDEWTPYEAAYYPDDRTAVRLEAGAKGGRGGPNGWYWGVCSPKGRTEMIAPEKERRDRLRGKLVEKGLRLPHKSNYWLQYEHPSRYANWYPLVPDLYEECDRGGGTITTYFADNLLNIAAKAIPAITEIEGRNRDCGPQEITT